VTDTPAFSLFSTKLNSLLNPPKAIIVGNTHRHPVLALLMSLWKKIPTICCRTTYPNVAAPYHFLIGMIHFRIDHEAVCSAVCFMPVPRVKTSVWWPGLKNSPTVTHACRNKRLKWLPSAWGYSWATLSQGIINTEARSSRFGVGRWTNNPAL
jgi:hypothetical protein